MTVEPVPLSASNARISTLRRLSGRRRARLDAAAFVVEGPVAVAEVLSAGLVLDELFVDVAAWDRADPDAPLRRAVEVALGAGTPVWSVPEGVLDKVADTVSPQGLVGVAPRRPVELEVLLGTPGPGPLLVLVDLADPGNAGTLVRAAEAAGAVGVVFAGRSTDPFGPKAVRAAAGSLLRTPVAEAPDTVALLAALRTGPRRLVATVAEGGRLPEQVELAGPVALLVGSEAHGLAPEVVAVADDLLTIPLAAPVESLNAAVAGSIALFEAARQRRTAAGAPAGTDWTTDPVTDRLGDR